MRSTDRLRDAKRWVPVSLVGIAALAFVAFRSYVARPPVTSDDLVHFEYGLKLLTGEHPAFSAGPLDMDLDHWGFRLGIVIPTAIAIQAFGNQIEAYYAVPLFFSALGFLTLFWINHQSWGIAVAAVVSVIHIVYPFEIFHGSRLFADLPAGVMLLLYFTLVDRAADRRGQPSEWGFIVAAGLALFWGYELRTNHPFVMAPGIAVLLLSSRHRRPILMSGAMLLAGIFGESLYYALLGGGWSYRWERVRVEEYMPFYSRATLAQYLTRHFHYVDRTMGFWATAYYVLALLGHVWLLFTTRSALIRALVVSGLCTWLLFGFYIHGLDPDGRLVVFGLKHRFMQPFYFTSLIVLGAALARAGDSIERETPSESPRQRALAGIGLVAALSLLLVVFGERSLRSEDRLNGSRNSFHRTFSALDEVLESREADEVRVATLPGSARTLALFSRTPAGRLIRWEVAEPDELANELESADHLIFNPWRESARTGFESDEERREHLRALGSGLEIVAREFVKLAETPDLSFYTRWGRTHPVPSFPRLAWSAPPSNDHLPEGWRAQLRRGEAEFEVMDDEVVLVLDGYMTITSGQSDTPGPDFVLPMNVRHELLLQAGFVASELKVQLVRRSFAEDEWRRARNVTIFPGTNVIGIDPTQEPRALQLELHVNGHGRFTLSEARLRRVDLLPGGDAR